MYANTNGGNRPDFLNAAPRELAISLYNMFNEELRKYDLEKNVILIKGSVPGANKSFVVISNGVKAHTPAVNPEALVKGE